MDKNDVTVHGGKKHLLRGGESGGPRSVVAALATLRKTQTDANGREGPRPSSGQNDSGAASPRITLVEKFRKAKKTPGQVKKTAGQASSGTRQTAREPGEVTPF